MEVTAATTCGGRVEIPGYYKLKDDSYYKVAHSTFTATSVTSSPGANTKGQIDDADDGLILDSTGNKITMDGSGEYLYLDDEQVFTSGGTTNVVLKSNGGNSIVMDDKTGRNE